MAKKSTKYPEEDKLNASMKALRERAKDRDYTAAEQKQMDGWRAELSDKQFRRLAMARVNKSCRMILLLGNLSKHKPSEDTIVKIEDAYKEVLSDVFTKLRGKKASKAEGFVAL